MNTFFTVDRVGTLTKGLEIDLVKYKDIRPAELQNHVDSMFPKGVSRHGDYYFLGNESFAKVTNPSIEILFEYVRRARYGYAPI